MSALAGYVLANQFVNLTGCTILKGASTLGAHMVLPSVPPLPGPELEKFILEAAQSEQTLMFDAKKLLELDNSFLGALDRGDFEVAVKLAEVLSHAVAPVGTVSGNPPRMKVDHFQGSGVIQEVEKLLTEVPEETRHRIITERERALETTPNYSKEHNTRIRKEEQDHKSDWFDRSR